MKFSRQVKPISKLKAHASEETQESLALLKILALADRSVAAGKVQHAEVVFARLRRRLKG
jgi:hypothetical protein